MSYRSLCLKGTFCTPWRHLVLWHSFDDWWSPVCLKMWYSVILRQSLIWQWHSVIIFVLWFLCSWYMDILYWLVTSLAGPFPNTCGSPLCPKVAFCKALGSLTCPKVAVCNALWSLLCPKVAFCNALWSLLCPKVAFCKARWSLTCPKKHFVVKAGYWPSHVVLGRRNFEYCNAVFRDMNFYTMCVVRWGEEIRSVLCLRCGYLLLQNPANK